MAITSSQIKQIAADCGFELAGIAVAEPHTDFARFDDWRGAGRAGEMGYLTDRRGDMRADPRSLLPEARTILCVGKLYNTAHPYSIEQSPADRARTAWVSRYAWGEDYHKVVHAGLQRVVEELRRLSGQPFASKICVDTAPLLERSYARMAGLGWIGRNTCLINQQQGSWFFLGEVLLSLEVPPDAPPPDRCGTCRRCIDACPTVALLPDGRGEWTLDGRLCISYLTIEQRGDIPEALATQTGNHVFGCDICQDVCPWNRRAAVTADLSFQPAIAFQPDVDRKPLVELANLDAAEFNRIFQASPIWRSKYSGFLRNVAVAMGNTGQAEMVAPLQRLTQHSNSLVAGTAERALHRLRRQLLESSA